MYQTSYRGPRSHAARLVSASVLVMVFAVPAFAQQRPAPVTDSLARMNESIDALTKKVWPSVVQILVTSYGVQSPDARDESRVVFGRQSSVGSGFVIDADGYIMTNAHVVSGAQRLQVVLPAEDADGTLATALSARMNQVPAHIVGLASELDLALLKVDMKLPALPLATYSNVRQGETVFAFGSPIGLRNSLTHGLVSAVARQVDPDSPLIYVQTDAPINPGNSGGPLVNIRGEVVGVNTFIMSQSGGNEGLGFAIPSATARTVFRQLKQYGQLRRQEIGMSMQTITPGMAAATRVEERLRGHRFRRLAGRPGGGGRTEGWRYPRFSRRPARRQPSHRVLQLPLERLRGECPPGGIAGRRAADIERESGRTTQRLRFRVRDGGCAEKPGPRARDSRRRDRCADCRRGDRAQRCQRRHRDRPGGGRDERGAAAAKRCHPQPEQPPNLDAAEPEGCGPRCDPRGADDAPDST